MPAKRAFRLIIVLTAGVSLAACVTPRYATQGGKPTGPQAGGAYKVGKPYQIGGVWFVPREQPDYDEVGIGSWYGDAFHMKATANGELFDMNAVSAAHTTLPLPSVVEVTNLENVRKIEVRVNDRGPFVNNRIIDLSREAARQLGYDRKGIAKVRVRYLGPAPLLGRDAGVRFASAKPAPPPPEAVTATALPPWAAAAPATAPPAGLRIQAGAFSSQDNAQRAVSQLSPAGQAVIEPLQRADGATLYRVVLPAPEDEAEAFALRDRVAEIGFADARVIRPF